MIQHWEGQARQSFAFGSDCVLSSRGGFVDFISIPLQDKRVLEDLSRKAAENDRVHEKRVSDFLALPASTRTAGSGDPRDLLHDCLDRFQFQDARKVAKKMASLDLLAEKEWDLMQAKALCMAERFEEASPLLARLGRAKTDHAAEAHLWLVKSLYFKGAKEEAAHKLDEFLARAGKYPPGWEDKARDMRVQMSEAKTGRQAPRLLENAFRAAKK